MAIAQRLFQMPNLPADYIRPVPLASILQLDPTPALREKFNIREFALTVHQQSKVVIDADERLLPPREPGKESPSTSQELQVQRLPRTVHENDDNQVNNAVLEVRGIPHEHVKHEQVEKGKESERSDAALSLASAGLRNDRATTPDNSPNRDEQSTPCPFCFGFTTDSAIHLSAHIVECLSAAKSQKVKGKRKMRAILDVIPAASRDYNSEQVPVNVERQHSDKTGTETMKSSKRKRVARRHGDFVMEPLKKRRISTNRPAYKGVKQRASGRWAAEICKPAKNIRRWLGTFDTAEDAAMAYDRAAVQLLGVEARTNILSPAAVASGECQTPITSKQGTRIPREKEEDSGVPLNEKDDKTTLITTTTTTRKLSVPEQDKALILSDANEVVVSVPVKMIDLSRAASDYCGEVAVIVGTGRLEKGRPSKVKTEVALPCVPMFVASGEEFESPRVLAIANKMTPGKAVIGSTRLEILD